MLSVGVVDGQRTRQRVQPALARGVRGEAAARALGLSRRHVDDRSVAGGAHVRDASARHSHIGAVRLTRSAASQYSVVHVRDRASRVPTVLATALFTRTVRPPSQLAALGHEVGAGGLSPPRSAATKVAAPPSASMRSTTARPRASSRPWTTTRAPSAANSTAIALPIPDVDPSPGRARPPCASLTRGSGYVVSRLPCL